MITLEKLKEYIKYDPYTGIFVNKINRGKAKKGAILKPDNTCNHKYGRVSLEGQYYLLHRLAWFYMTGRWPISTIDHINNISTDNRFCNLREASKAENEYNSKSKGGSSKYKGVSLYKKTGKWTAQIHINGRKKHLGYFKDEIAAALEYNIAAKKYFGEFAKLNNIE